jgi:CRP-like cAMP-binding protein
MDHPNEISSLQFLFRDAKSHLIHKGEVIHSSDQPPMLSRLLSGYVKRYFISHNGSLGVQAIYGPGDIFPLTVVFKSLFDQDIYQGPETYYYESMSELKLQSISGGGLREKVESKPVLNRVLLQHAGRRFHSNIQFLENLRLHGAYCKTAHQLAYFGIRFGENQPDGTSISLPLTHQDLADVIGTTRETVTAAIIKLRDKKIIRTGPHILILDFEKLVAEAYS